MGEAATAATGSARNGLRQVRLPLFSERYVDHPVPRGKQQIREALRALREERQEIEERMLALVAFDDHLVDEMNLLLDEMQFVVGNEVRHVNQRAAQTTEAQMEAARAALEATVNREVRERYLAEPHPTKAIDKAALALFRHTLSRSDGSLVRSVKSLSFLADLETAWRRWAAAETGRSVDDLVRGDDSILDAETRDDHESTDHEPGDGHNQTEED